MLRNVVKHARARHAATTPQSNRRSLPRGAAAPALGTPALILYGKRDEVIPGQPTRRMVESLPPAPPEVRQVAIYDDGYHMLTRDLQADLVLSDIKLPDASGYEVFTKAREILPNVPVVLMTGFGYDPNHTIIRASADGVQGILLKPFRTEHFVQAIRNALLRDSAQSP